MKNKLVALSTLLMLLISTIPFILHVKPVEASITGPSLIVDDTVNQIHATLGAGAGSVVTVKGTVTNLAYPGPPPLLTGVFYRENMGPGITPPDLTIFWSPDGIAWLPAGPIWCPTAYPGYQLELIIGGGGYWLPPGGSSTVYIKTIANRPLGPTDVEVIVFVDSIANSKYDPGEPILTIPPPAYDFPVKIDLSIWNTAELDPATFFSTIQAAINAATPGQTIYVYPGTYNENLVVNKALTIQGADKETTIIQAQPVSPYGGDITIEIKASNVAISEFDISGYAATQAKPGSTYWGVYAYGSSGSHYSNINVTDSVFTFLSQSGIQLGYVDGSLIRDNIFKRETRLVWYKPPGTPPGSYINVTRGGAGPALWYCTNVTIDPNVIQTDGVGIFLYSSSDVSIEANVISAPDTANPSDVGIHVQSCTGISIVGNDVFNYTAGPKSGYNWGTNGAGVNILGSQSINVRNNSLHDNTVGVLVQRLDLAPEPRKADIHYNNFENNAKFGVLNCYTWIGKNQTYTPASYVADARFNWWDDSSGPTHSSNLGGTGDAISDNVDYSPWLGFVVGTSPMTWHVNPTGTIQEAVDEASSGDTIIVHDGTYNEALYINKNLVIKAASTPIITGGQLRATNYGNRQATIFVEDASNVVLQGLDVEGQGLGVPGGTKSYAVLYENSSGTVQNCTVSSNTVGDMYSAAIAAWDNSDLTIKDCMIKNFGRIGVYSNNATMSIEGNRIIGQVYNQDYLVNYGIEIEDYSGPSVANISQNVIYNCNNTSPNPLWSSAAIIVDTWREWADYYQLTLLPSNVSITFNEIYDNYESIEIVASELSYAHYNNFHDNTYGVWSAPENWTTNPTYHIFDARYNWWGSQTGPYHSTLNPTGLGDMASDYVNFIPWLQLMHDVSVMDVAVSPTTVVAGQTVTINVTVKNEGSDYENFTVTAYYDSTAIGSQNVTNLLPNWNTTLTFYWSTTGMPRGNYTTKAVASTVPGEVNTTNNVFIDGKVQVLWHDVAVVSIASDRTWVFQGHSANINVTVKDNGDFPEAVTVTLYYNITSNKIIGTQNIALIVGEIKTIIFVWNTVGVAYCHNYTLTAVVSIPADNNPADNTLSDGNIKVRIVGDLNGDGKVDGKDITIAALSFASYGPDYLYLDSPPSPRWNPDADINQDGKIDGKDLTIIARNFGMFCSP